MLEIALLSARLGLFVGIILLNLGSIAMILGFATGRAALVSDSHRIIISSLLLSLCCILLLII
jgi:hypothetical protein